MRQVAWGRWCVDAYRMGLAAGAMLHSHLLREPDAAVKMPRPMKVAAVA